MITEDKAVDVEKLLAKAKKPAADAMVLHPFYRGKVETTLKCVVRDINDFAIWYTPGVAAPCRDIEAKHCFTNIWVVSMVWPLCWTPKTPTKSSKPC